MVFNRNISNLDSSASIELMQTAERFKADGRDVINLAGGEPDFVTPDRICEAAENAIRAGMTHYAVGKGLQVLRKKIAEKLQHENNIGCDVDKIIVTPGGKFGIYMAVSALVNQGDEVIILNPAWVSYGPIVEACGGIPVYIELDYKDNYKVDSARIRKRITNKTKAIIINYPNNPTGKILSSDEAEQIAEMVKETGIFVIADEIYEKIVFDNKKSISIASYQKIAEKVITINGFSKCAAMTGWRLGYTVADQNITDVMYKLYTHTITGASPFIQMAALEVFNCKHEIESMRQTYETRRNYFITELNKIDGISCREPEGTFYAWVYFDTTKGSNEIARQLLLQLGVVGVPGQAYGSNNSCCIRFSFACADDVLKETINRIKRFHL